MKKLLIISAFLFFGFAISQTSQQAGNWNAVATWGGSLPSSSADIVIAHNVILTASDNRSVNSVTVNSSKTLTINSTLTVATTSTNAGTIKVNASGIYSQTAGTFTNNRKVYVYAGGDFELGSSVTAFNNNNIFELKSSNSLFAGLKTNVYSEGDFGSLSYSRYINGTDYWDLIGAPLNNVETIQDFAGNNNDIATNGSAYAIGTYTNTSEAATAGTTWSNYTTSTIAAAGNFVSGVGYQMATDGSATGSEVIFTGRPKIANVTVTVTTNEEGTANASDGTKFALIANPYSCYVNVTTFINDHKTTQLHAGHVAVYGWDGTQYDTYNLAAPGNNIAPGQGFIIGVKGADATSQTITFTNAMKTTTGSGDYSEQNPNDDRAELYISLDQNNTSRETKLVFLNEGSDVLDIGYDAGTLDIANNTIYSRLVSEDEGVNMSIQSLNFSEINDKVISLGINADAGAEATISLTQNTTNPSTYVYLEDVLEGTFTNLKETDFVITPDSDLQGVGRFFVHTSATTMSNEDVSTNLLNAFKLDRNNFITIEGLATQSNQTNLKLYNLLGQEVLSTILFNNTNTQTISTEGLSAGIYVIKLESGNNLLTKKLIIK